MKNYTVFLVDDDVHWRSQLAQGISADQNLLVIGEASDGNEAVLFIQDARPDILIIDLVMPNMDGIGLVRFLRTMMPGYNPVLYVLTGYDSNDKTAEIRDLKVDCLSLKPIKPRYVISNIHKILAQRESMMTRKNGNHYSITGLFEELGIPPQHISTARTKQMLQIYIEKIQNNEKIKGQDLYKLVTDDPRDARAAERSVRSTIQYMQKSGTSLYREIFRYDINTGITNLLFFARLAKYVEENTTKEYGEYDHTAVY